MMKLTVQNKSVNGKQLHTCILNEGTHRCQWIILNKNGTKRQCGLKNALFEMDISMYKSKLFPFSRNKISKEFAENTNINISDRRYKVFCWMHAQKITGLRVVHHTHIGKDLISEREIPAKQNIAVFRGKRISTKRQNELYGFYDTGPYLWSKKINNKTIIYYDSLCYRDLGDYCNDARINISSSRDQPACNSYGPRNENCWILLPNEIPNVQAKWVGKPYNKYVLTSLKTINIGDRILMDYNTEYWSGYYCSKNNGQNPWEKVCNKHSSSYKRIPK